MWRNHKHFVYHYFRAQVHVKLPNWGPVGAHPLLIVDCPTGLYKYQQHFVQEIIVPMLENTALWRGRAFHHNLTYYIHKICTNSNHTLFQVLLIPFCQTDFHLNLLVCLCGILPFCPTYIHLFIFGLKFWEGCHCSIFCLTLTPPGLAIYVWRFAAKFHSYMRQTIFATGFTCHVFCK